MVLTDKVLNGFCFARHSSDLPLQGLHHRTDAVHNTFGTAAVLLHGGHHDVQKCNIVFCPLFGIDISSPSIVFIRNTAGTACFSDEAFASGIQTAAAIKRTAHTIRRFYAYDLPFTRFG